MTWCTAAVGCWRRLLFCEWFVCDEWCRCCCGGACCNELVATDTACPPAPSTALLVKLQFKWFESCCCWGWPALVTAAAAMWCCGKWGEIAGWCTDNWWFACDKTAGLWCNALALTAAAALMAAAWAATFNPVAAETGTPFGVAGASRFPPAAVRGPNPGAAATG